MKSHSIEKQNNTRNIYDFSKYGNIKPSKYLIYSQSTELIQSHSFGDFVNVCSKINLKYAWINIFDPTEEDLQFISNSFNIHDITLKDIRERNTEEKLDVFSNYYFLSIKLFKNLKLNDKSDIDFNILLFKKLVITTHDKEWAAILDIVNFLSLLSAHTSLFPDWVLFSVVIEFLQDLRSIKEEINSRIEELREFPPKQSCSMAEMMKRKFELDMSILQLKNTIKPKVRIINSLTKKCLIKSIVKILLIDSNKDFKEILKETRELEKVLERIQDLRFSLMDMHQTSEANKMNKSMKWLTIVNFIFLPCQTVAGLWGMNVTVPGQHEDSLLWFWILVICGPVISCLYFFLRRVWKKTKMKSIQDDLSI